MIKSTIEQQKEIENMIAKISELENELLSQERKHHKDMERENNIKKGFLKEIEQLKKDKLKLIRSEEKANKRLAYYIESERLSKETNRYEDLTKDEKWEQYEENDTYNSEGEYDAYYEAMKDCE